MQPKKVKQLKPVDQTSQLTNPNSNKNSNVKIVKNEDFGISLVNSGQTDTQYIQEHDEEAHRPSDEKATIKVGRLNDLN